MAIGCVAVVAVLVVTVIVVSVVVAGSSDTSPQPPMVNAAKLHLTGTLSDPHSGDSGVSGDYFSPGGSTLYADDSNDSIYRWDTAARAITATIPEPADTQALALSPDGTTMAIGQSSGTTYLREVANDGITARLTDPAGPFSPEPQAGDTPEAPQPAPPEEGVLDLVFSPDGKTLAVADSSAFIDFYNMASARTGAPPAYRATLPRPADASIAFSPDGQILAASSDGSDVYLWDVAARRLTATLTDPDPAQPYLDTVTFSPRSQTLAVTDEAGHIYLWNATTHAVTARLTEPGPRPYYSRLDTWAVFSPDGQTLATWDGNADAAYLWDIATRRIVATVAAPRNTALNSVAFSPDGQTLATADSDGTTRLWAIPAGS